MKLKGSSHGTVVAYVALILAMGGAAGAAVASTPTANAGASAAVSPRSQTISLANHQACDWHKTLGRVTITSKVGHFYDVYVKGHVASTAKERQFIELRWNLDGANVGDAKTGFSAGKSTPSAVLNEEATWLAKGRHVLSAVANVHPSEFGSSPCQAGTVSFTGMHGLVAQAR
jgi:N-acetylmuramoyl-L-alanine amidase CwlA